MSRKSTNPRFVLIEDVSLLQQANEIRRGRGDNSLAKTVKDLLREKLNELRLKGDPFAVASVPETMSA